jgi:phosphoglycolate phosphatase
MHLPVAGQGTVVSVEYDALIYDLDGTLVELDVDWEAVTVDARAVLSARGVDATAMGLDAILSRADELGYRGRVEEAITDHERTGARRSRRLPLADSLPAEVPVAVCSLNAEEAVRLALEKHGLDAYVSTVVGRDTVDAHKPDPQPLLSSIEALSVDSQQPLFVGDTERDERTAERAGVRFRYASDWAEQEK